MRARGAVYSRLSVRHHHVHHHSSSGSRHHRCSCLQTKTTTPSSTKIMIASFQVKLWPIVTWRQNSEHRHHHHNCQVVHTWWINRAHGETRAINTSVTLMHGTETNSICTSNRPEIAKTQTTTTTLALVRHLPTLSTRLSDWTSISINTEVSTTTAKLLYKTNTALFFFY